MTEFSSGPLRVECSFERKRRALGWLRDALETLLPAVAIALLINLFLAQSTIVLGQSMESNLHSNQRLIVEKVSYRFHAPQRGDIVVFKRPEWEGHPLIKRVIGLPGERVEIRDGCVWVDGVPLDEPYLDHETPGMMAPIVVPPFHVFVLGDNRGASNDSRYFGPVAFEHIQGKAWLSYWPLDELKIVE